jgi:hypothetical protein
MKALSRALFRLFLWLPVLVSAWYFLGEWWAPDGCLDSGGSFDYVSWHCSNTENHPYIHVPIYEFRSFWAFVACLVLAASAIIGLRRRRGAV